MRNCEVTHETGARTAAYVHRSSGGRTSRYHRCWTFNRYWLFLALFTAVNLYLLIGGAIFTAIEGPNERLHLLDMQENRVNAIHNVTELLMNISNLTEEELQNVTKSIIHLGGIVSKNRPEQHLLWDYWSAFFFASTVITTIGKKN